MSTSSHSAAWKALQAPAWDGVLAHNDFTGNIEAVKPTPWGFTGAWTDEQDSRATIWFHKKGIHITELTASKLIHLKAGENRYHPLRERLERLQWDGQPRLDAWLSTYLGVEDTSYARAVGSKWLISAVARIFEPGCKADHCLIL